MNEYSHMLKRFYNLFPPRFSNFHYRFNIPINLKTFNNNLCPAFLKSLFKYIHCLTVSIRITFLIARPNTAAFLPFKEILAILNFYPLHPLYPEFAFSYWISRANYGYAERSSFCKWNKLTCFFISQYYS